MKQVQGLCVRACLLASMLMFGTTHAANTLTIPESAGPYLSPSTILQWFGVTSATTNPVVFTFQEGLAPFTGAPIVYSGVQDVHISTMYAASYNNFQGLTTYKGLVISLSCSSYSLSCTSCSVLYEALSLCLSLSLSLPDSPPSFCSFFSLSLALS